MTYDTNVRLFANGRAFPMADSIEEIVGWRESELTVGDADRAGCPFSVVSFGKYIVAAFGASQRVEGTDDCWEAGVGCVYLGLYSDERLEELDSCVSDSLKKFAGFKLIVGGDIAEDIEMEIRRRLAS